MILRYNFAHCGSEYRRYPQHKTRQSGIALAAIERLVRAQSSNVCPPNRTHHTIGYALQGVLYLAGNAQIAIACYRLPASAEIPADDPCGDSAGITVSWAVSQVL
ncbi:MAG: hypothetical protein M3Q16_00790, partial [Pseudomonadota bacterium]|nr:hypothetical protein [Pseudomonadota bacterium]